MFNPQWLFPQAAHPTTNQFVSDFMTAHQPDQMQDIIRSRAQIGIGRHFHQEYLKIYISKSRLEVRQ